MKIMNLILKNSLFLNLVTLFILVFGTLTLFKLRREAFPNIDFDTMVITTVYPGASPDVVELYVTDLIEEELNKIDGIEEMRSSSRENVSSIILKLEPDLSERKKITVTKDIKDAVDSIRDFPNEVTDRPIVLEINSGVMPVMELSLSGDFSFEKLHEIADDLSDKISQLDDAKTPYEYGLWDKEYLVEIDAKKLAKNHITMDQVAFALARENIDLPGGVLKSAKGDYLVRTISKLNNTVDLEKVVLRTNESGKIIKIADIGRAIKTFKDSDIIYRTRGKTSISLIIRKSAKGDILELVDSVKSLVTEYKKKNNLEKLEFSYLNDMSYFVRNRLGVLVNNGLAGIVLVLLALLLFLSKGIALVAVLGLPVAFLGAIIVMSFLGMTINLLTMFALVLVLGMLVDDSIIVAENIWQHYEQGKSPWQATVDGTKEVFWPVTTTILTTMAAFSPLLMVSGIFGKFISSMPKVVIVSLALSLFESMLILPVHAYDMLKFSARRRQHFGSPIKQSKIFDSILSFYQKILRISLRFRYLFVLFICGVLASCLWLAKTKMKVILFPEEGIETFYLRASLKEGTTLKETSKRMKALEKVVEEELKDKEFISYVTYVGLQQDDTLDPFREKASHLGQIGIYLTPENERTRSADKIISSLRKKIQLVADQEDFLSIAFSKQRMGPPVGKPVAVQIIGKDYNLMKEASKEIQKDLSRVKGVKDIKDSYVLGLEQLNIKIVKEKVSQSLLSSLDIALNVRRTLEGDVATYILENGKRTPVRVRYKESQRQDENYFKEILMRNHMNHLIPIRDLITIEKSFGPNTLKHIDGKRLITVTSSVDEKYTSSSEVNDRLENNFDSLRQKYPSLTIKTGGEYEETAESMQSLAEAFLVALAVIFLILVTQFKSLTQPLVIMLAIPFGFVGVILAFYFHNIPLSFLGFIGAIGLSGVVVNDSIVLVDFANHAMKRGMTAFDAIVYAGKRRFRAVCLTSITTIAGVLPLVYGIGGFDNFLRPAAMALGYGLLFATVLILIFIPAVYLIREDIIDSFHINNAKEEASSFEAS